MRAAGDMARYIITGVNVEEGADGQPRPEPVADIPAEPGGIPGADGKLHVGRKSTGDARSTRSDWRPTDEKRGSGGLKTRGALCGDNSRSAQDQVRGPSFTSPHGWQHATTAQWQPPIPPAVVVGRRGDVRAVGRAMTLAGLRSSLYWGWAARGEHVARPLDMRCSRPTEPFSTNQWFGSHVKRSPEPHKSSRPRWVLQPLAEGQREQGRAVRCRTRMSDVEGGWETEARGRPSSAPRCSWHRVRTGHRRDAAPSRSRIV